MQVLSDTLQRRVLHPSPFWLNSGSIGSNSVLPDTTGRQLLLSQPSQPTPPPPLHQQPSQMDAAAAVGGLGSQSSAVTGGPLLHSLNNSLSLTQSLGAAQSQLQGAPTAASLLAVQRPSVTSGRVCAPLSQLPSAISLQDTLQRSLPAAAAAATGGALSVPPSLFNPAASSSSSSSLRNKQGLATPLPSQQVT